VLVNYKKMCNSNILYCVLDGERVDVAATGAASIRGTATGAAGTVAAATGATETGLAAT
jgi:hypothetical protein